MLALTISQVLLRIDATLKISQLLTEINQETEKFGEKNETIIFKK